MLGIKPTSPAPIAASFTANLQVGSRGSNTIFLQTWLIQNGYDIPSISSNKAAKGFFGNETRKAVQKYQKDHGIPQTGFVGPLTRTALNGEASAVVPVKCPEGYTCKLK